jgi:hypothetical protein
MDPESPKFAEAYRAASLLEAGFEDDAACRDGTCGHYVCTEGRSLDEWAEPEPTQWDYNSEAFGPSAEI